MNDNEIKIWNAAILKAMEVILDARSGFPGPYYDEVYNLLEMTDKEAAEEELKIKKRLFPIDYGEV